MTHGTWESPITVFRPRSVRTKESRLWGTPAGKVTSSKRFMWSQTQTDVFRFFVLDTYPNHKSCDLAPLLRALNLDGYDSIRNQHDESVYQLIVEKVRRKIGSTERAMRDRGVPLGSRVGTKPEPALEAIPHVPEIDRAVPTTVKKEPPSDGLTSLSSLSRTPAFTATAKMASRDRLYKEAKAPSLGSQNCGISALFGASNSDASKLTTRQRPNDSAPHSEQPRTPMKQPLPLSNQYKFPGLMPSSSTSSYQFTGRTDVFAPFVFEPELLHPEPEPAGAIAKAAGEEKPKASKEEKPEVSEEKKLEACEEKKLEATRKKKPDPPNKTITADESLRKRQLEREGLVNRMEETLNDFGEELLDAHQAPEETDEWYEEVDAMKRMYEFMQLRIRKLKKLEPLEE